MLNPHNATLYNYLQNLVPALNENLQESIRNFATLPNYSWFLNDGVIRRKSVTAFKNYWVDRGQMKPLARRAEGQFLPRTNIPDVVRDSMELELFGEAFPVTREYLKYADNQLELTPRLNAWVTEFGSAGLKRMDDEVASIYLDAFDGDIFTTHEGFPLLHDAHTFQHGGSNLDNLSHTPLSLDGLQEAIDSGIMVDSNGKGLIIPYDTILIGPKLETELDVILESLLKPGTPNNDANVLGRRRWNKIVVPHFQDEVKAGFDDVWFVTASSYHTLEMHVGQAPAIKLAPAANGLDFEYQQIMDMAVGWYGPKGIWGSDGTAT